MNETLKQLKKAASGPADNAEEETRTKASQAAISKAVRQKKGSSKKTKQTDDESEENFLDNEEELIKK